jgi:hypothetical protein
MLRKFTVAEEEGEAVTLAILGTAGLRKKRAARADGGRGRKCEEERA